MITHSDLNDDVEYVIKGFVSPFDRFKMLRNRYSNRFLKSVFERKKYKQLELIHSKLVQIINDKFRGFEYLFNTVGLKTEPLKHKHIIYHDNLHSWRTMKAKMEKSEIIKKIVDIFQRLDDVVSLQPIECLVSSTYIYNRRYHQKIVVSVRELSTSNQGMFSEGALKILCVLAYISKNK